MLMATTYRLKYVFKDGKIRRSELEQEMIAKLAEYKVSSNDEKKRACNALKKHLDDLEKEVKFFDDLIKIAKTGIWDDKKSAKWFVGRNFAEWGKCIKGTPQIVYSTSKISITIDHVTSLDLNRFFLAPYIGKNIYGCIPSSIQNLKYLTSLDMCFNFLIGSIPSEIQYLTSLETLKLEFNQLHGKLPSEMSKLKKLRKVCIDHNRLEGSVAVLGKLPNLKELNIHENKFIGTLPEILASRLTHCWFYRNTNLKYGTAIAGKIDKVTWKAEDDTEK